MGIPGDMLRRLLLPLLVVAAALTLSGCNQQVVGFSSISVNGKVTGSVDGKGRPAVTGSSAKQAADARVVTIDPTTTKLTLYYGETIELDFAGSWMVHPIGKQWQWVCPAFVSARWLTTTASNDNSLSFQKSYTDLLGFQERAVRVPWEYGTRCQGDFSGRKVTLGVPAYGTFIDLGLQVTAYSGNLFQPPPPERDLACLGVLCALIGSSSLIEVDVDFPPAPPAPRTTGLYFTLDPGQATSSRQRIARAALDGGSVAPAFLDAGAAANSIAVRGEYLYWSTGTAIGRARLDGSDMQPAFIGGLADVGDIAVTDRYVFWVRNGQTTSIGRAELGGANADANWYADPNLDPIRYLAANSTHVYIAPTSFASSPYFRRIAIANPADVAPLAGGVGATEGDFAVDDTHLYVTGAYAGGGAGEGIGRMALATATTVGLAPFINAWPDYEAHWGIAVDGQHVYWASRRFGSSPAQHFIGRANLDGTEADPDWLSLGVFPGALAVSSASSRSSRAETGRPGDPALGDPATRAGGYSATTSIRMLDGAVVREGRPSRTNGPLAGAVLAGSYRWALPARTSGTARPRGLAAFLRGRYVSRVTRVVMLGGATSQVGVGDGLMLLRGASARDLLCLQIRSGGLDQRTRIVGGRGAGAALRGETTGDAYRIPFDALGVVTTGSGASRRSQWAQVEPFSNVMKLTASRGVARDMPAACRSLVGLLPTPDPAPTPVTG
jgi:hypothetical protein